ncbi:MAG: hypothetical protein AB7T10_08575 [bacterium]
MNESRERIMKMPEKSMLLLSDFTNTHYDIKAADAVKRFSKDITPNVKASAVLGVTGIKRILFNNILRMSGRHIALFETYEEAIDYLVKQ